MTGNSRGMPYLARSMQFRAMLICAFATAPAIATSSKFTALHQSEKALRADLPVAGAGSAVRRRILGFCGPVGGLGGILGARIATSNACCGVSRPIDRSEKGARKVSGTRLGAGFVGSPHGSSLVSGDTSTGITLGADLGSMLPKYENCASSLQEELTPSALPYFGREDDNGGVDSVLKGIKVGHGIRYSRHPKTVLFTEQPALNNVVQQLHDVGMSAVSAPAAPALLDFTFGQIQKVREEVEEGHNMSERKLSALGQLLVSRITGGKYSIQSIVTAQSDKNIFSLSEKIPLHAIDKGADSAQLAKEQLDALTVDGKHVHMADHSIEFSAEEWNEWGVHRVIAHARPAQDLWKVIADSLFGLEHPEVQGFVDDDMYHLKIVVEDEEHAARVHKHLRNMEWTDTELMEHGIPADASTRKSQLVEQSEHSAAALGHKVTLDGNIDASGDRSSTVKWWGAGMQIRVQTLNEYYAETEMITMANRERLADRKERHQEQLAAQSPVYGFARNLMRWMLADDHSTSPPVCGRIHVKVHH